MMLSIFAFLIANSNSPMALPEFDPCKEVVIVPRDANNLDFLSTVITKSSKINKENGKFVITFADADAAQEMYNKLNNNSMFISVTYSCEMVN